MSNQGESKSVTTRILVYHKAIGLYITIGITQDLHQKE